MPNSPIVSRPQALLVLFALVAPQAALAERPAYCGPLEQQHATQYTLDEQNLRAQWQSRRDLARSVAVALDRALQGLSPSDRHELSELLAGRGNRAEVARRLRAAVEPVQTAYYQTVCPQNYVQIGSSSNRWRECQSREPVDKTSSYTWVDLDPPFVHHNPGLPIHDYKKALVDRNVLVLDDRILESGERVSGPHRLAIEACHSRSADDGRTEVSICHRLHLDALRLLRPGDVTAEVVLAANGEPASFPETAAEWAQFKLPAACREDRSALHPSDSENADAAREALARSGAEARDGADESRAEIAI